MMSQFQRQLEDAGYACFAYKYSQVPARECLAFKIHPTSHIGMVFCDWIYEYGDRDEGTRELWRIMRMGDNGLVYFPEVSYDDQDDPMIHALEEDADIGEGDPIVPPDPEKTHTLTLEQHNSVVGMKVGASVRFIATKPFGIETKDETYIAEFGVRRYQVVQYNPSVAYVHRLK